MQQLHRKEDKPDLIPIVKFMALKSLDIIHAAGWEMYLMTDRSVFSSPRPDDDDDDDVYFICTFYVHININLYKYIYICIYIHIYTDIYVHTFIDINSCIMTL
jgi:hypothetical protein